MNVFEAISCRRSTSLLTAPGPTPTEIRSILSAAVLAPDHGNCEPWRFVVINDENRHTFGEVLAEAYRTRCDNERTAPDPDQQERERKKIDRAPVVIVVACRPRLDGHIPVAEQRSAVAAATQNMLLAATALGYGSMWRTGRLVHDPVVRTAIDLDPQDTIEGFVYLGSVPPSDRAHPRRKSPVEAVSEFYAVDSRALAQHGVG